MSTIDTLRVDNSKSSANVSGQQEEGQDIIRCIGTDQGRFKAMTNPAHSGRCGTIVGLDMQGETRRHFVSGSNLHVKRVCVSE